MDLQQSVVDSLRIRREGKALELRPILVEEPVGGEMDEAGFRGLPAGTEPVLPRLFPEVQGDPSRGKSPAMACASPSDAASRGSREAGSSGSRASRVPPGAAGSSG